MCHNHRRSHAWLSQHKSEARGLSLYRLSFSPIIVVFTWNNVHFNTDKCSCVPQRLACFNRNIILMCQTAGCCQWWCNLTPHSISVYCTGWIIYVVLPVFCVQLISVGMDFRVKTSFKYWYYICAWPSIQGQQCVHIITYSTSVY